MTRHVARLCAALILGAVVLVASPASAHVTVSRPDARAGGYGKVVFRVPTESDTASTTKVRVTLPEDTPFASVGAQPKPGWTVDVEKAKLDEPITSHGTTLTEAVRTVTWSTDGDGIAPGEFDEFALSLGRMPDVEALTFAAEQTYDDGEVVAWDQPTEEGQDEPEHPAPVLELASAPDDAPTKAEESSTDQMARTMSGVAVAAALLALVVALQNRRRA
jgi:uncharacterized protein